MKFSAIVAIYSHLITFLNQQHSGGNWIVFSIRFRSSIDFRKQKGMSMGHAAEHSKSGKPRHQLSLLLLFLGLVTGSEALAHGGGLNAQGCHNNRKTGDYHCHRAQQVSPPVATQFMSNEDRRKLDSQQPVTLPQQQQRQTDHSSKPTCYTGPRGGTYTITASGRKNYNGC